MSESNAKAPEANEDRTPPVNKARADLVEPIEDHAVEATARTRKEERT